MEVLEEERAILTRTLSLVWMRHGDAIAGKKLGLRFVEGSRARTYLVV